MPPGALGGPGGSLSLCLDGGSASSVGKRVSVLVSSCMFHIRFSLAVFVVSALCTCSSSAAAARPTLGWLFLPAGFRLCSFSSGVPHLERSASRAAAGSALLLGFLGFWQWLLAVLPHQPGRCLGQTHEVVAGTWVWSWGSLLLPAVPRSFWLAQRPLWCALSICEPDTHRNTPVYLFALPCQLVSHLAALLRDTQVGISDGWQWNWCCSVPTAALPHANVAKKPLGKLAGGSLCPPRRAALLGTVKDDACSFLFHLGSEG